MPQESWQDRTFTLLFPFSRESESEIAKSEIKNGQEAMYCNMRGSQCKYYSSFNTEPLTKQEVKKLNYP